MNINPVIHGNVKPFIMVLVGHKKLNTIHQDFDSLAVCPSSTKRISGSSPKIRDSIKKRINNMVVIAMMGHRKVQCNNAANLPIFL